MTLRGAITVYGVHPMALDHDPHAGKDEPELLDRIDALRVLRASSPEEKGRLLEEIGGPATPAPIVRSDGDPGMSPCDTNKPS